MNTAIEIHLALQKWPEYNKPKMDVEYDQWTFECENIIGYGKTPLGALYHCATLCDIVDRANFGSLDKWNGILEYLKPFAE